MAIVASLTSVVATGSDAVVFEKTDLRGGGPYRLFIKNSGDQALTACKVQLAPDDERYVSIDTTTFASLGSGSVAQLLINWPVESLRVLVTCASGTTVDAILSGS